MIPDIATVIGPVVRMCANPDCHGLNACPSLARDLARVTDRSIGLSDAGRVLELSDEALCQMFAQSLALHYASDSRGFRHLIPDGCEFTVHKGAELATAVYSGPETRIDDILAGAPEHATGFDYVVMPRLRRMREAGLPPEETAMANWKTAQHPGRTTTVVTEIRGGWTFHVVMIVLTGGAWALLLPFFLRTRKIVTTHRTD